jgi:hypothetical protein
MYPCYAFEFHLVLIEIDPEIGRPIFRRYLVGHDCGTVINPDIVRGSCRARTGRSSCLRLPTSSGSRPIRGLSNVR